MMTCSFTAHYEPDDMKETKFRSWIRNWQLDFLAQASRRNCPPVCFQLPRHPHSSSYQTQPPGTQYTANRSQDHPDVQCNESYNVVASGDEQSLDGHETRNNNPCWQARCGSNMPPKELEQQCRLRSLADIRAIGMEQISDSA